MRRSKIYKRDREQIEGKNSRIKMRGEVGAPKSDHCTK